MSEKFKGKILSNLGIFTQKERTNSKGFIRSQSTDFIGSSDNDHHF